MGRGPNEDPREEKDKKVGNSTFLGPINSGKGNLRGNGPTRKGRRTKKRQLPSLARIVA